jgi:hypothetical protein
VAIAIGADLLAADEAAIWPGGRIDSQGRLNSTGNTRTCSGGESFLGRPKQVDVPHTPRGLAAASVGSQEAALFDVTGGGRVDAGGSRKRRWCTRC